MSPTIPAGTEIPRWPKITATLNADGTGRLTIDGADHSLQAPDIDAARASVIKRVATRAQTLNRPVRLNAIEPGGRWELAVHPDGTVEELTADRVAEASVARATDRPSPIRSGVVSPSPALRSAGRPRRPRRRIAARVGAGVVLLLLCAAIAIILASKPDTVVHAPTPRTAVAPTTPAPDRAAAALAAAKRRAAARNAKQAAAASKRRARVALERRVAARQARRRRAARAHRLAVRRAREARAARRRAAAQRAPTTPPPVIAPRRPAPRRPAPRDPAHAAPAPSATCGEFDLC